MSQSESSKPEVRIQPKKSKHSLSHAPSPHAPSPHAPSHPPVRKNNKSETEVDQSETPPLPASLSPSATHHEESAEAKSSLAENLQHLLGSYSEKNKQTGVPLYDQSSRGGSESDDEPSDRDDDSRSEGTEKVNSYRRDYDEERFVTQAPADYSSQTPRFENPFSRFRSYQFSGSHQPDEEQPERQLPIEQSDRYPDHLPSEPSEAGMNSNFDQSELPKFNFLSTSELPAHSLPEQLPSFQSLRPPVLSVQQSQPTQTLSSQTLPTQTLPSQTQPTQTQPTQTQSLAQQNPLLNNLRVKRKSNRLNHNITKLTAVSYNLWFQKFELLARTSQIIKTILASNPTSSSQPPDVIAFQEATSESYNLIKKRLGSQYIMFDTLGEPPAPYGTVLAINRETLELDEDSLAYYDFPETGMGRKLMTCQVTHKKTSTVFYVLNTHLESLTENWKIRRTQMNFILNIIKAEKIKNLILLGDFNICDEREPIESIIKYSGLKDAWIEMGSPQSLKNTYDYQANQLVKGKFRSRLDRVLYRFAEAEVVIVKFKFLGVREPASDHFGLLTEFLIKKDT